jgi:hypothetical protein
MRLRIESMPDDPSVQAILYGPLVLAGKLGSEGLTRDLTVGTMGPKVDLLPIETPSFRATGADPAAWIKPASGGAVAFETVGQKRNLTLAPLNQIFGERYSVYWQVT